MMYRQRGGSRPAHQPGGAASANGTSSSGSSAAPRSGFGRLFSSGNDMAVPPSSPLSVAGWTSEPAPPRSPAVGSISGAFSPLLAGHVGQAPPPPPRPSKGPAQQRVKKAKAYSISLLTGHSQQGSSSSTASSSSGSNASAAVPAAAAALPAIVEPRRSTSGDRPGRRSQEMPWIPPRSQSALGAYEYSEPSSRSSSTSGRRHILQRTFLNDDDDDAPVHVISNSANAPPALPPRLAEASSPNFLSSLKADSLSFSNEAAQPRTPGALSPGAARNLRDEPSPASPGRAGPPKNRRKFSVGSLLEVRSASSQPQSQSYDTSAPTSRLKRKPPPAALSTAYVDRGHAGSPVPPNSAPLLTGAASEPASLSERQRNYARSAAPQRTAQHEYVYREPPSPRDAPMSAPHSKRFMSPAPRPEPPTSAGGKAQGARAEVRPPPRRTSTFGGLDGFAMDSSRDSDASGSAASGSGGGAAVVHALGQIGGMGAAVGKRGWDLMRSWNPGQAAGLSSSSSAGRGVAAGWGGGQSGERASLSLNMNEATRRWLAVPDASATTSRAGANQRTGSGVFGMPLRDAVLQTSLGRLASTGARRDSRPLSQLDALDLGSDFHVPLLSSPPMGSRPASAQHCAASREEARERYLPAVVVRCLQSLEKWGGDEEGIYRLSGRSSHTAKLRTVFDAPVGHALPDLELIDIGPADLDINSVCSVLKHYLRELPEPLLTDALTPAFDEASMEAIGMPASGATAGGVFRTVAQTAPKAPNGSPSAEAERLSSTLAKAIAPLIARLPACNWYMLREIAEHLADFCRASVVAKTKMPLSNLSLVLAPTLSLSVVMLRALVEHRSMLFREKGPQRDAELDGPIAGDAPASAGPERPRQRVTKQAVNSAGWTSSPYSSRQNSITSLESPTQDWASSRPGGNKRASILTLKGLVGGGDKRASASSVATLRGAFESGDVTQLQRSASPTPQPTRSKKAASPTGEAPPPLMNDDDLADAPPIAARFVRQRTLSNASQLSMTGLTLSPPPPTLAHKTSQASLVTRAAIEAYRAGSTTGGDSPRSTSGWESDTGSRRTSGESERSNSNGPSALSRPRPPTSGETHFFAKKNIAPTTFVSATGRTRRGTNASSIESSASFSSTTTSTMSSPGPLACKTEMSSVSSLDSMPKTAANPSPPLLAQAVCASAAQVLSQEEEQHLEPYASVEERRRAWESGMQRFA